MNVTIDRNRFQKGIDEKKEEKENKKEKKKFFNRKNVKKDVSNEEFRRKKENTKAIVSELEEHPEKSKELLNYVTRKQKETETYRPFEKFCSEWLRTHK